MRANTARKWFGIFLLSAAGLIPSCRLFPTGGEAKVRAALQATSGVVELPAGVIEISSALEIPRGAHDLKIHGAPGGTLLRATDGFRGRALMVSIGAARIEFSHFALEGNRRAAKEPVGLPPSSVSFSEFFANNGLLIEDGESVTISDVNIRQVAGFAILVSRSSNTRIERVQIEDSGSTNAQGRNNTSGGILLEEGCSGFQVRECVIRNVGGNGIWTHSRYTSPRNRDGQIIGNRFSNIARDAIQVGHATNVRVENNSGSRIGYPVEAVDVEGGGTPVAIDTAGNTDQSAYLRNRFEEINGKCIDLDGFHDGEVRGNTCINRRPVEQYPFGHYGIVFNNSNPDMRSEKIAVVGNVLDGTKFGGIFVIGTEHTVSENILRNVNLAHCNETGDQFGCNYRGDEPDLLQAGIYLGAGAERRALARENVIQKNEISGFHMGARCIIAAPRVSLAENKIEGNLCRDEMVPQEKHRP